MHAFTLKTILSVAALGTVAVYIGIPNLQSPLVVKEEPESLPPASAAEELFPEEHIVEPTPVFGAADKLDQWESFDAMHARYTKAFVESEGFGISRVVTFRDPGRMHLPIDGLAYQVTKMQLIGLSKDRPVVYLSSWLNVMRDQLKNYEARTLTDSELESVERLEAGESLTWDFQQDRSEVTLVGALRAEESCIACHQASEGELLGAFVYSMQQVAPRADTDIQATLDMLNNSSVKRVITHSQNTTSP